MPVRDIARTAVVTAGRDQSAGNLATVMKEESVGSVIIIEAGQPVGIVTDRDLVIEVLEPRADPQATTAGEIMTETPVTLGVDEGIYDATETLYEHAVRRLPVVDADGNVAGTSRSTTSSSCSPTRWTTSRASSRPSRRRTERRYRRSLVPRDNYGRSLVGYSSCRKKRRWIVHELSSDGRSRVRM